MPIPPPAGQPLSRQPDISRQPDTGKRLIDGKRLIGRFVQVERTEVLGLLVSFAYFFSVLCAYYIIRPVRDEMGVAVGPEGLRTMFGIVFIVMLAAVPVFGWVVARFPRRLIVPVIYAFFISNLFVFWILMRSDETVAVGPMGSHSAWLASTFFVWTSVFNLFIVSLFWSLMSDLYRTDQAKRLYGFIAAGGSFGAFSGPVLTQSLVEWVGPNNLLLLSAFFLGLAMMASLALRRLFTGVSSGQGETQTDAEPVGQGLLSGAVRVWQSPLLFRIAMWVLLANLVSTLFYLEQSRIVGEAMADRTARVLLFSRIDLAVNVLTLLSQVFVTARVLQRLGVLWGVAVLPAWACLGLLALAMSPTLAVIAAVMAVERVIAFSLASPAVKVLYTGIATEDKYKAQNFIDTVVYRGGDAGSGWLFHALSKGLGLSASALAISALPMAMVWLGLSWAMANGQGDAEGAATETPPPQ